MKKYRKIYEQHYGRIPSDEEGRTYDIHHKDGNKKNNDPQNLIALSILDHFNVHYQQHDWGSCFAILRRMAISSKTASELLKEAWKDPNYRAKQVAAHLGWKPSEETIEKQRQSKLNAKNAKFRLKGDERTEAQKQSDKHAGDHGVGTYTFISPDGQTITITNLSQYCRDNDLNYIGMKYLTRKYQNQTKPKEHQGWRSLNG